MTRRKLLVFIICSLLILANFNFTFALDTTTEIHLYGWGYNLAGQIGDGTNIDKLFPTLIGEPHTWTRISAGGWHTLAIDDDGKLFAWGSNGGGQIGDGTGIDINTPTQIGESIIWTDISTKLDHSLAIDEDGKLYAWGKNNDGQLGDGTTIDRYVVTLIDDLHTWTSVAASSFHSMALDENSKLYAWGNNKYGQHGDGTYENKLNPTLIDSPYIWTEIAGGTWHTLGIDENGFLYAWGLNSSGQLGDGTFISKLTPTLIDNTHIWTHVSAGDNHSAGIDDEGNIYTWGSNYYGQIGDGTSISKNIPTQIDDSHVWSSISSGDDHTMAIDEDGKLYAWGSNDNGELGDGTTINRWSPTLIDDSHVWISIAAGRWHTHGLCINLNGVPDAYNDNYTTDEDILLSIASPGIMENDVDPDGDLLTALLVNNPLYGAIDLNIDGSFSYLSNPDFYGTDIFTYKVNDGTVDSINTTVTITINPVNDPPIANDDFYNIDEDTIQTNIYTVQSNDIDIDSYHCYVYLVDDVSHGTLELDLGGYFTYTPESDFNGTDNFTYILNDGEFESNEATATITVNPINDTPVSENDQYFVSEDGLLTVSEPGVLDNDSDADGDSLTSVLASDVTNGTLNLSTDGSFTYEPNTGFTGNDSFTYIANDGVLDSSTASVNITVSEVNTAPVAVDDAYSVAEDGLLTLSAPGILDNDSDADGDALTSVLASDVANGTLNLSTDGSFTYEPDSAFTGNDSFTYMANDGILNSSTATVNITINETTVYTHLVKRIDVSSDITEVEVDKSIQMNASIKPNSADLKTVVWSIENGTGSASIDDFGLLTGIEPGEVTVIASAMDESGIQGIATINVIDFGEIIPVTEILVEGDNEDTTISRHEKLQMIATVYPENATYKTVIWSISSVSYGGKAKISTNGELTALRTGTVTIRATATDGSGIYGDCIITIE